MAAPFDLVAVVRCCHEVGNAVSTLRILVMADQATEADVARFHEALDALNTAAGRDPPNVVRIDFSSKPRSRHNNHRPDGPEAA